MSLVESLPTPETNTWCESGTVGDGGSSPGDIDPTGGDIAHGWPDSSTPPARQRFNWIDNLVHRITRYFRQRGTPEYHSGETYPPGARVQDGDGVSWKRIGAGNTTGVAPGSDGTKWVKWGHTDVEVNALADTRAAAAVTAGIGDLSAAVTHGDITSSSNVFSVAYEYACRFPGSTIKQVFCRLTVAPNTAIATGTTITLAGTAAFATGADNVIPGLSFTGNQGTTEFPQIQATVSGNQTIAVYYRGDSGELGLSIELLIQGH